MSELTRKEVTERRKQFVCDDYKPLPRDFRCQHYVKGGACSRSDYFMCIEWVKRNPEQAMAAQRQAERQAERARDTVRPTAAPVAEPPATKSERPVRQKHLRTLASDTEPGTKRRALPGESKGTVYDLSTVLKEGADRPLLEHPELLTEAAVEALEERGIEVTAKTANGNEITLVPAHTDNKRAELTWAHARTIVMILQVFPGATITSILKPTKKSTG